MARVIERGELRIREETLMDKHVNSMMGSIAHVRHFGLGKAELVDRAARLSALQKLIAHNEHKIPGETKFQKPKFEYSVEEMRAEEGIGLAIERLARETKQSSGELMEKYREYLGAYSAEEVKMRVLEKLDRQALY